MAQGEFTSPEHINPRGPRAMRQQRLGIGGKPDNAMGGGTDILKLDNALASVDDFVAEKL